ncbi:MAG: archaeoflavoprotein AfpA [Candidatus Bathyarchaeota archaeon]|nr:archaeoflavoprotein AfpA [Candidatus Bathyarchaeum tardum]
MSDGQETKRKRVTWGITGSGDRINEVIEVLKQLREDYKDDVRITVYTSKAGEQVTKFYGLFKDIKDSFEKVRTEVNANVPTLAVQLQSGKIEFLIIAPVTSNTIAKLANGIADTLLTNSAIMALKTFVPVYLLPCDLKEGTTVTQLPDGSEMKLQVRTEEAEQTKKLGEMKGVFILEKPEDIKKVFQDHFKPQG